MAIISSCCCWKSVRKGSFASGFYTLIYYSVLVIGGSFRIDSAGTPHNDSTASAPIGQPAAPLSFTVTVLISAGTTVLASIVLLVGLCVDNRLFLLPWITSVTVNTLICSIYSVYLIATMPFQPLLAVIFTLDFFISLLNVYCLLCVISQYQEYKVGRGRAEDDRCHQPSVKYDPWGNSFYPSKRSVTFQENGRPSGCLANKKGNSLESKTLLAKPADNNLKTQRPRIHFQEERDSSDIKGISIVVSHDSPSTDTTSSRLQSEASMVAPSPPPSRQKRVQFSSEVVDDDNTDVASSVKGEMYATKSVPRTEDTSKNCVDSLDTVQRNSRETLSNGVPTGQFISSAAESLPLLVTPVEE